MADETYARMENSVLLEVLGSSLPGGVGSYPTVHCYHIHCRTIGLSRYTFPLAPTPWGTWGGHVPSLLQMAGHGGYPE